VQLLTHTHARTQASCRAEPADTTTKSCPADLGLVVEDGFIDEATQSTLLGGFPAGRWDRFLDFIDVPRDLYNRIAARIAPGDASVLKPEGNAAQVPARREFKSVYEHKDYYPGGPTADGRIGLL
jgi:hypothetical protein